MLHIVSFDYTRISSAFFSKNTEGGGPQQEKYPHKHPVMIKN